MKTMALALAALLMWSGALAAPSFDFHAPASPGDPSTPAVMRDLAERLLPVYQDADNSRYLANLSALQMVAGSYAAADASRQSLRERRPAEQGPTVDRSLIYDIYANAKAIQAENRVPFSESFATAFRGIVSHLSDRDAFRVTDHVTAPPTAFRDALQKSFDQLRSRDSLSESDALQLIWTYLSYQAFGESAPLVDALAAEDDRRRYEVDAEVTIKTAHGRQIFAQVIRPKELSAADARLSQARTGKSSLALPALLEFTIDDSRNTAKECAAHGYVGVVAYSRGVHEGQGNVDPYRFDGDDARLVIKWITEQPWSDGRVAMYGEGYSGFAAWAAAKRPPSALKAIATAAPTAPGIDFPMVGGIFRNSAFRWSLSVTHPNALNSDPNDNAPWQALDRKWYSSGRRYRDLGEIFGEPNPLFIRWLNHPSYDLYWQALVPFENQFASVNIPVLTTTGFYSAGEPAALYYFAEHLRYNPRADHTLVIGPYGDQDLQRNPTPKSQGYSLDQAALVDLRELRYQWFDHILKGLPKPALLKDRVNYEVMGANEWRHAASLETIPSGSMRVFLEPNGRAGSHALARRKSADAHFIEQKVSLTDRRDADWVPDGDWVARHPTMRNALMFSTEPLTKSLDLTGLFVGHLDLTVNKMDLDFYVSMYEKLASGQYLRLFDPSVELRASYAENRVHRRLLRAGERQQLNFTSERMVSRRLRAGSRLVMVLGIIKRPDRELNYGTGNDVSEESIADGDIPVVVRWFADSYIDLPARR
jgi:putative CocE/NonD family hydrolase